jgi:hypothetical protein
VAGFERALSLSMAERFSALTDAELKTMVRMLSKTREIT